MSIIHDSAGCDDDVIPGLVDKDPWRAWFAWYPVKVGNEAVWFETVYRRKDIVIYQQGLKIDWVYTTLFDVLKEA